MNRKCSIARRSMSRLWPLLAALCLLTMTEARGQGESTKVSRSDFASAYVRFETALLKTPLSEFEVERVNKEFDGLSLQFLTGRHGEAMKRLRALTASLESSLQDDPQAAAAASLRAAIQPPVFVQGDSSPLELHLSALFSLPAVGDKSSLTVRVTPAGTGAAYSIPLEVDWKALSFGRLAYPVDNRAWRVKPGRYDVALITARGNSLSSSSWFVVSRPPEETMRENALRLAKIRPETPELIQALACVSARNRLLTDKPAEDSTAQWLIDREALAADLADEVRALEQGKNPYRARKGDTWRVLKFGEEEIPFRVYLSEAADLSRPLPLVVAFHGAGGDENMFMEGYGSGILKRLASQRKFLLVTPGTAVFSGDRAAAAFDLMLDTLGRDYPLDRERIYAIGHSLGGWAVNNILNRGSRKIAAACCLCGFQGFPPGAEKAPPLLVVAAELDPIVPASRLETAARRAAESGQPVEYRLVKGFGHTLVVGRVMVDVLDWLFQRP